MIIVKRRGELVRLGFFLVLTGAMAYYVMTRAGLFVTSSKPAPVPNKPVLTQPAKPANTATPATADPREYFAQARITREDDRAQRKQELTALIDNPNVDAGVRKTASEELQAVMKQASLEVRAEALLRGRGVEDVLVTMTDKEAVVDVIAKDQSEQHARQLADAVAKVTGLKLGAISVRFRD